MFVEWLHLTGRGILTSLSVDFVRRGVLRTGRSRHLSRRIHARWLKREARCHCRRRDEVAGTGTVTGPAAQAFDVQPAGGRRAAHGMVDGPERWAHGAAEEDYARG